MQSMAILSDRRYLSLLGLTSMNIVTYKHRRTARSLDVQTDLALGLLPGPRDGLC